MTVRPYLVNGEWRTGEGTFEVKSPFDDSVVAEFAVPTAADVEEAMATAAATFDESKKLPIWARSEALDHISKRLAETVDENAELIAREGGKPIKWAKVEATRAISTFRWASEVIRHGDDELMRLDTEQSLGSRVLAEFFDETDLPKGMYQVLPVSSKIADGMARDERYRKISFTGSSEIGWYLKGLDPKKRVTLELGGNAGVIVHSDADLDFAAQRIAFGGYYQAGQSCISVQRVYVASDVYDRFAELLTKQVQQLKVGDPLDPTVDVGPVIQRSEVDRIGGWVQEAVSQGAEVLTGGTGEGPFF